MAFWRAVRRRLLPHTTARMGLAELVGQTVKTTADATGLAVVAQPAIVITKALLDSLLPPQESLDSKVDRLLAAPYRAGVKLLRDASLLPVSCGEGVGARERLLEAAHTSFTQAASLVAPLSQDFVFLQVVDTVTLAAAPVFWPVALRQREMVKEQVSLLTQSAEVLRAEINGYEALIRWVEASKERTVRGIEGLAATGEIAAFSLTEHRERLERLETVISTCNIMLSMAERLMSGYGLDPDSIGSLPGIPASVG